MARRPPIPWQSLSTADEAVYPDPRFMVAKGPSMLAKLKARLKTAWAWARPYVAVFFLAAFKDAEGAAIGLLSGAEFKKLAAKLVLFALAVVVPMATMPTVPCVLTIIVLMMAIQGVEQFLSGVEAEVK